MIRKFIAGALSLALLATIAGCAQLATGINQVTASLSSANATQALTNLEAGATVLICNIPSLASETEAIDTAIAGGSIATIDPKSALAKTYEITSTVLAVSQVACTGLQGTVGGKAAISAISNGVATAAPVGATH